MNSYRRENMIFKHVPLYRFLALCENTGLTNEVLDCGAGGDMPPLSLFKNHGFDTFGIELSSEQLELANEFAINNNQELNIELGDMRELKFSDNSISYVYSYNSIFHMRKKDIELSINEMKRVLKKDGLMFVNFLSDDDFRCGEGPELGDLEFEQMDDELVIHSYFRKNEAEKHFLDMQILFKETRIVERMFEGNWIKQGFIDYILRKK